MMYEDKYNIICLSNQVWNFPHWTNKRHVMSRLSKLGHRVLFVNPPINTGRLLLRQLLRGEWTIKGLLTRAYEEGGVRILSPLNPIPFFALMAKFHAGFIKKNAGKFFYPDRKTILWIYNVEAAGLSEYTEGLTYDLLIYDCVDNYSGFPRYNTKEKKDWINSQEKYLAEKADLVFATAPGLVEKLTKYNSEVYFTPNVGDYEKFRNVRNMKDEIPPELKEIPRPRIGFTGALDEYKFDVVLVKKIAKDHPNYSFVLIGPIALKDREASLDEIGLGEVANIYFLGSRPYEVIEKYFAGFDAYIIPYQLNDYTVGGCFPVKFHDSLAAGLPTVVTNMPAYAPFKDVAYISKSYEEFSANVKIALSEDSADKISLRQKVASENTWDKKVSLMLEYIRTKFKEEM